MGLWFLVHTSNMGYFISDCFVSDCLCEGLCGQLTWSEIIKIGVFYEDKASDDEFLEGTVSNHPNMNHQKATHISSFYMYVTVLMLTNDVLSPQC